MGTNLLENKKNYLIVGRAATGIYLILESLGISGKKVLFPANICYAAIYPAVYAGNQPAFCDVDAASGNLTLDLVYKKVEEETDVAALVLPHMYGNPVKEIAAIKAFCAKNNILLIEDCAAAMGASIAGEQVGQFGDYVIYSTGYAKTIELGFGGIVASDCDLQKMERLYRQLPGYSEESEYNQAFFSKLYRLIRNDKQQTIAPFLYRGLYENVKDIYIYQISSEKDDEIKTALLRLEKEVAIRRENYQLYNELLNENGYIEKYVFEEGAVPWRYNLFVTKKRKEFISYILEQGLPISDWYPDVTEIFGVKGELPNTRSMEEKIINFPLNIEQEEIRKICYAVNTFFEEKEV